MMKYQPSVSILTTICFPVNFHDAKDEKNNTRVKKMNKMSDGSST